MLLEKLRVLGYMVPTEWQATLYWHVLSLQSLRLYTLKRISMQIIEKEGEFCIAETGLADLPLTLDAPPNEITTTQIVKSIGDKAEDTHRVEVPFSVIAPKQNEIWSKSTSDKVAIPLGRSGATKLQNLTLGRGTAQHALIAGKTGSGKSTLLHVLVTNLALWYSPEEVEFYLVDFKKGVEFKTYATHKLPHARVVVSLGAPVHRDDRRGRLPSWGQRPRRRGRTV